MNLTCIAIDDEYLALQVLREYSKQLPFISLAGEFTNPVEALAFLESNVIDVILLDIQMPFLDGFQVMERLRKPPMIIFTTARHDFAVKAYEMDVLDYLVKPIAFERFKKAIEKAIQFKSVMFAKGDDKKLLNDALFFRADFQIQKVTLTQIDYLEGLGEYVKVHTSAKTHITLGPMKELMRQLPEDQFVQIHKSYVVRLLAINSYTHRQVKLGQVELPLGRIYKKLFLYNMQKLQH